MKAIKSFCTNAKERVASEGFSEKVDPTHLWRSLSFRITFALILRQRLCGLQPCTLVGPARTAPCGGIQPWESCWRQISYSFLLSALCSFCQRCLSLRMFCCAALCCQNIHVFGTGIQSWEPPLVRAEMATHACQETTPLQDTLPPASRQCMSDL